MAQKEEVKMNLLQRLLLNLSLLFGKNNNEATPTPTPSPTPTPNPMQDIFKRGFEEYGSPLATASAQFAKSAQGYPLPDPYLPAVLALMETGGGKRQKYNNNPFNWGMQDMPSLDYTIDRIYSGIGGRMPVYKDYLETKDLGEFFSHYTPQGNGNPPNDELIRRYNILRSYFDTNQQ